MPSQNRLAILAAAVIVSACSTTGSAEPSLNDDLLQIMDWWDGDYDNTGQVARLITQGKPIWRADESGEGGHIEVESHYRPTTLPAFGEHVIYVEEYKHGDPEDLFRQRIYTLSIDENLNAIRVKLWNFKDKESYRGAWQDLSMLTDVSPDDMSPLPDNCDLIVARQDGKFHMPMRGRDCAFGDRYFNYQVLLGPDSFWFRDKIVLLDGDEVVSAAGGFTYHELERRVP